MQQLPKDQWGCWRWWCYYLKMLSWQLVQMLKPSYRCKLLSVNSALQDDGEQWFHCVITFSPFLALHFHSFLIFLFFFLSYCSFSIQASLTKLKNTTKTRPDLLFLTLPRTPTRVKDIPWFFWSLLSEISLSLSAYSPVALYLAGSLYPPYPPCLPCSPYLRCLPQPVPVSFMSYKSTTSNCPPCPSFPPSPHFPTSDMIFVQLFTTPDFQAKIFTL